MDYFDKQKFKKIVSDFTIDRVEKFLIENPSLEFYAFAYDCNAEYAEINLSFNTETEFGKTLKCYQSGEFSKNYETREAVNNLRLNTGNWKYLSFESINVLSDEELTRIFNQLPEDDYKSWNEFVENLMRLFCECFLDFIQTDTYKKIVKTDDFIAFCINHDEDFENAIARLEDVK